MQTVRRPITGIAVLTLAACALMLAAAGQPDRARESSSTPEWARSFRGLPIFTEPARSAVIGFDVPTSVTEILVVGGQPVKAGDLLVRGDEAEELATFRTQEIQTRERLGVERARTALDQAEIEYRKTLEAFDNRGASQLDVDRRRAGRDLAAVDVRLEVMRAEQSEAQLERFAARVERFRLRAPFDGVVESVSVDLGQTMSEAQPVVKVVNTSTMRMDVPTPTDLTIEQGLGPGSPAWVLLDVPGESRRVYPGRITEVSPVAFYATRQRRVRVEIENVDGFPAGLGAWVRFTEPGPEWLRWLVSAGGEERGE
jgi:membrane fusion protein (multidrug efflux system)